MKIVHHETIKENVTYVITKYGKATMGMTVAQMLKMQHIRGICCQTVVTLKKKDILSNKANKQNFLSMLIVPEAGCSTAHSRRDADVLIVRTAIHL